MTSTITNSSLKLVALVTGVAVAIALMGAVAVAPAQAAGLNQAQIQSIVSLLASFGADSATIANVTAALNGQATTGTGGGTSGACPALTRDLQQGSSGADVKSLQVFLNGSASTQLASAGAGSPGNESTYFGSITKAAVIKFQVANSVSPAVGYVGPITRAAIAAVCGTGTGTGTGTGGTTTGGMVSVSAGAQPVNSLAPGGAQRVPFTTFTISNNSSAPVIINSVTVQRVGLGTDANFAGIVLLDQNGLQIGIAKTLNSNHQANIGDNFTIGAGQSMTLTVAGNMGPNTAGLGGQIVALQVVAINTGATVSGSLPISGASQTINDTLVIGAFSTSTSSFDPGATQNKSIGDTGVRFAGLRFTANSAEDLKLYSIRWRQIGTGSSADLSNVVTNVNGTAYAATVDSSGKYYTSIFPGGIMIPKGQSIDAYIQGDLSGSNSTGRTIQFTIDRGSDVYFVGQLYGYGVTDKGCTGNTVACTNQPWFTGSVTNVQAGTATTIGRASEVGSQNIGVNVANQPLGAFATDFTGEAVSVQTMTMTIATSTGRIPDLITDLSIVNENGNIVAGPVDATWVSSAHTSQTVTFSDTVTFPTGRHVFAIRGKIPTTAVDGTSLQLTVTPSNWTNATGQTSGSNITVSGYSPFTLASMTVKGASFTVSMSSQPGSQSVVANASGFTFANVQLDASQSGEDIRINTIPLRVSSNTGLSGCMLKDSTGLVVSSGSNVPTTLSTSAVNNFVLNNSITVAKGTIKTLSVVCNLSNGSGNYTFSLNVADTITVTGITSGNSFSATNSANSGGTMAVGSPSAAVTVALSSPAVTLVAAGQTGVTVGKVNVRASNEALTLTSLGLKLTSGDPSSIAALSLYDSNNALVGTMSVPLSTSATATSSISNLSLPVDTDVVLTIKADLAPVTSNNSALTEGALVKIDPVSAEVNSPSQGLIRLTGTGSVAGVRVYKTFPVVAMTTLTSNVQAGKLLRFSVTADSHNPVSIGKFVFTLATTTATIGNIGLYVMDANGNNVSQTGAVVSGLVDELLASSTGATPTCNTTGGSSCSFSGGVLTLNVKPATNAVQVPLNTTYTFELRASTISSATTGASVTTRLLADTSASPSTGTGTYSSLSGSHFIWSPNATTTASMSAGVDWTNGYQIQGFQSDLIQGISQ